MQSRKEALDYGLAFPDTYVETPFRDTNWQLVRVKCSKKAFLWIYEKDGYVNLNVKADKEWRDYWRSAFKSVIPGWHQNKENWNTIILDGSVPDDAIKTMIKESYELVTDNPTKRIYEAVKKIPKGCVATYGQIAELAGNKGMARAVGNALHRNPDPDSIPCYRVVNSKGELSGAFAFGGAGLPHAQGKHEIPAPNGGAQPGPCLPHSKIFKFSFLIEIQIITCLLLLVTSRTVDGLTASSWKELFETLLDN